MLTMGLTFGFVLALGLAVGIPAARRERAKTEAFYARMRRLRDAGICTICEGTGYEKNERGGPCFGCAILRECRALTKKEGT